MAENVADASLKGGTSEKMPPSDAVSWGGFAQAFVSTLADRPKCDIERSGPGRLREERRQRETDTRTEARLGDNRGSTQGPLITTHTQGHVPNKPVGNLTSPHRKPKSDYDVPSAQLRKSPVKRNPPARSCVRREMGLAVGKERALEHNIATRRQACLAPAVAARHGAETCGELPLETCKRAEIDGAKRGPHLAIPPGPERYHGQRRTPPSNPVSPIPLSHGTPANWT